MNQVEEAQARVAALQEEQAGLSARMQAAIAGGSAEDYFQAMARQHALPREIREAQVQVLSLTREQLQGQVREITAELTPLKAARDEAKRRAREVARQLEEEYLAASRAYDRAFGEIRNLREQMGQLEEQLVTVAGREA